MLQELHQSAISKEKCAQLEKELKLTRDSHHTLQGELNKAKESLLKFETVKEVAKTKEEQMLKDHDAYDKQVDKQAKEIKKLREELTNEVKRREDLVQQQHTEIQKI